MFQRGRIEELPPQRARAKDADAVLKGLRVVDFTHFVAGPVASMMLADFGADVIKVEAPGKGDEFRHYPPVDPAIASGAPFIWNNRSKRSIAIDLKTSDGLAVVRELISQADVVMENFSKGVMSRFGLDYDSCARINPRLIHCAISAYRRDGPNANRLGFDTVAQAESGFISMNGYPDREGTRTGATVMDIGTGMMAANAVLLALLARERTGKGQSVEVSLFDTAVTMTGFAAMQYLTTGVEPQRYGNTSPDTCPSGAFRTKDKSFIINCPSDAMFVRLLDEVVNRPDIASDPVLRVRTNRLERQAELFEILEAEFGKHPFSYWEPKLKAAAIPYGLIRTVGESLLSDEIRESGLVSRIAHPTLGWVPNIASPIRLSETPAVDPKPAPSVGENTLEVLRDVLHYDEEKIDALRRTGALGAGSA